MQSAVELPGRVMESGEPQQLPPSLVQTTVMRFADTFSTRIVQATQAFAAANDTPDGQIQAMGWNIGQRTAAITIAAGPNPNSNLLDMIVLVTLGRMVHEEHWLPEVYGEADRPMLEAYQGLETEIWAVASQVLSPTQQEAVRTILSDWRASNPDAALTGFVRLPAFRELIAMRAEEHKTVFGELVGLVSLDPLSGLEPTTREIEQTRLFAERTLYYVQREALIIPTQVELLVLKLTRTPAVGTALGDGTRISEAAASLAATAAALPESVRIEREAAVQQISRELTAQREGLVHDLEEAQAPARELLTETRATLATATETSGALQGAIAALDAFIGRWDKEEAAAGAPPPPAEAGPPKKPFDVLDYGSAAADVGAAAEKLTELVATLEQSLPEARSLMDEVAQRGERAIDHAFWRGLVLGTLLIAGAALAVLVVRRVSGRWASTSLPGTP
jgi:hypothetical protein